MTDRPHTKSVLDICDAALALEQGERERFIARICRDDSSLRRSVESVLEGVSAAGDFLVPEEDSTTEGQWIGQCIGSYRIVDRLGEGGMGSVFLAERDHDGFRQRVAVKLIRGRFLANELIERFHAERRILARLSHPYIAALIDGGTTETGIPYLVMEFVEGQPVDQYCDEHGLAIHARIRLVQKIAMAVQSAHQNLVVHRDLKPSNVLITADGIPKLLDFGIAKLIDPEESAAPGLTALYGRQAMTPDYASPEQILENSVTTASDVYTLGILTYQLLAGERPYRIRTSSRRDLVRSVESLSVPRLSSRLDTIKSDADLRFIAQCRATTPERLKKLLVGDLDNILMKALERAPERRYVSVAAFCTDLERYLKGMPVEARPDSIGYRASRFVARHRIGVAASAVSILLIVGGLAATSWAWLQAEAARKDASARFEQVRAIAGTLMFDVYEDIEKIPGTFSARETLASTAQTYLETLATPGTASPEVLLDVALGYARLSSILNRQAVSDPENRLRSRAAWDKSFALLSDLTETHPDAATVFLELGKLHSRRGADLTYIDNKPVEARVSLDRALEAFGEAGSRAPDHPDLAAARLTAQQRYADSYKWQRAYADTVRIAEETLADIAVAVQRWPDHPGLLKVQADTYQLLGEARYFLDDYVQAISDYGRALAANDSILGLTGPDQALDNAMIISHWSRGNALIELERPDEAAVDYDRAIVLLEVQTARDPGDASTARRLAVLRGSKAMALVRTGASDEAVTLMEETNAWFEAQAAADPDTAGVQRSLAVSHHMVADILGYAERHAEACTWYERTLATWERIDRQFGLAEFDAEKPEELRDILNGC